MSLDSAGSQTETAHHRLWNSAPWVASLGVVVYWVVLGNRYSLWLDEAFSVRMSQRPFLGLARQVLIDEGNMGPYYLALWFWEKIFPGDQLARALAVIGTVAAIWGLWTLLRRRSDPVIAAAVVLVFASNPFVLSWSIQVRGFSLVMAASAWALVAADSYVRTRRRSSAMALGALTGLSVATLLSSMFVYFALFAVVYALSRSSQSLKNLALAGAVALVVFAPFSYAYLNNRSQVRWIDPLSVDQVLGQTVRFFGGPPTALAYVVLFLVLIGTCWNRREARPFVLAIFMAAFTCASLAAFSLVVQPLYVSRYLAASSPYLAIGVVGWCVRFSSRARVKAAAVTIIASIAVTSAWGSNALPRNENYRWAVSVIEAEYEPGDGIAAHPSWVMGTVDTNWDSPPSDIFRVRGVDEFGRVVLSEPAQVRGFPKRLWLVVRGPVTIESTDDTQFSRLMELYPDVMARFENGTISVYLLGLSDDFFG